jgi:hypothetical protein
MLDQLIACAGEWRGTNTLQDPEMGMQPETTESAAKVAPLLDGRFVRIDYTWACKGTPQSGSMLVGHQTKAGLVTMHWIDTWHNGEKVMALEGPADGGGIDGRGSYNVPGHPDWGWRIRVEPSADALMVTMWNVSPEGQEHPAVEARYSRH